MKRQLQTVAVLVAIALLGGGCTGALVGAGATAGVTVAQERSVGSAIDDATIHVDINRRLLEKHESLFRRVGIEVIEGRVLLTGAVPEPDDRIEAVRIAWTVKGVREVINEIEVTDKTGVMNYAKDVWITTQLRTKMLTDTKVSDINYNIETVNGVIYLMGIAQGQSELDRVTNYAREISGVRQVKSHVQLKDDPRRRGS
jgi:osmotically-inducible protein OsmY